MTSTFKAIIPKKVNVSAMITTIVAEAQKQGKAMVKDFEKTTKTWEGEKPEFRADVIIDPQNAPNMGQFPKEVRLEVHPKEDGSRGAKKWGFLDKGTKVRHAVMSNPFVAKTTPKLLSSKRGRGKMIIVRKDINRPGIKARKWSETLQKKWKADYAQAMRKAMGLVAKASGHGMDAQSKSAPIALGPKFGM